MTEQQAINVMEKYTDIAMSKVVIEAHNIAIEAIKEVKLCKEDKMHFMPKEEYEKLCDRLDELESLQNPLETVSILLHNGKTGYQCKNCGNELAVNAFNGEYCHWCGQRLKWGNEDAE